MNDVLWWVGVIAISTVIISALVATTVALHVASAKVDQILAEELDRSQMTTRRDTGGAS